MKRTLLLSILYLASISARSQCSALYELSISERVNMSDIIVEAKVLSKESFWNEKHDNIYTLNKIEIYKVFRGTTSATEIIVVTPGGEVGNYLITQNPSLQLQPGQAGMFFLKSTDEFNNTSLLPFSPFAGPQSFIRYDLISRSASDPFKKFDQISLLYNQIERLTHSSFTELKTLEFPSASALRSSAVPVITSWDPVAISAGTNSVLNIHGTGFGSTMGAGYVSFNNADHSFTYTDINYNTNIYYQLWSDTLIRIMIPAETTHDTPGFGFFWVTNDAGQRDTSNLSVNINFGLYQRVLSGASAPSPIIYSAINNNGGILFTPNDSMAALVAPLNAFQRAMNSWTCASKMNWTISNSTSTLGATASDGVNLVTFNNNLSSGVAAYAQTYMVTCSGQTKIFEVDLIFRGADANWQYGPAAATFQQSDFEGVALHELGHAQDITHNKRYGSCMQGGYNRTLYPGYDDAATDTSFAHGQAFAAACSLTPMTPLVLSSSLCNNSVSELNKFSPLTIYPNPSNGSFVIRLSADINEGKIEIIDAVGNIISEKAITGSNEMNFPGIAKGAYVLRFKGNDLTYCTKLIMD